MNYLNRFELVRFFALQSKKIVDIGCNIGETFGEFATNVDIRSLEEKRKESKIPGLIIPNFVQADAANLPFKDFEYDCAVLSELLEHVDDPIKVLNEAQRISKYVLVCVPNEYEWSAVNKPFTNTDHKRTFDEKIFMGMLSESGMLLVQYVRTVYGGWSYMIALGASKNLNTNEMM